MISVYTIRNLELRGDKARLLIYVKFQEFIKRLSVNQLD